MQLGQRMTQTLAHPSEPGRALYDANRKNTRWYRPWDQLSAKAQDNWNRLAKLLNSLQTNASDQHEGRRRLPFTA